MTNDPIDDAVADALGLPRENEPSLSERARARRTEKTHPKEKTR